MARQGTAAQIAGYMQDDYWKTKSTAVDFSGITRDGVVRIDISALSGEGKQLARWAMASWESVADIDFREVKAGAEVTIDDAGAAPIATYRIAQDGSGLISGADLTIPKSYIDRHGAAMDQYAYHTYLHEIGHVLGLGHTGPYDDGNARYADAVFSNDSWQMSVMSYFSQNENPTVKQTNAIALGPMAADIHAAQAMFGAPDTDATKGDTVWGKGSRLDTPMGAFFREMTKKSSDMVSKSAVTFFVKDTGGEDTIDFSFDNRAQTANLSRMAEIVNTDGSQHVYMMIDKGTQIENYRSGNGADKVIGTAKANDLRLGGNDDLARGKGGDDRIDGDLGHDRLFGNGGDDVILGGAGMDLIRGGGGNDRIEGDIGEDSLFGQAGNDVIRGGDASDRIDGGGGRDRIDGGIGGDVLSGQAGNDVISGGDGADRLDGGGGRDRLDGGAFLDQLTGGKGADTFVFAKGTGTDHVRDFELGTDQLEIDAAMLGSQSLAEVLDNSRTLDGELMLKFESGDRIVLHGIRDGQLDDVDIVLV